MKEAPIVRSTQPGSRDGSPDDLRLFSVLSLLWRGKWTLVFFTLLAAFIGGVHAFRSEPVYTATATIALSSTEQKIVDFQSILPGFSADLATVNTEIGVLHSRGLIGQLVDTLGLTNDPEFNRSLRERDDSTLGVLFASTIGAAKRYIESSLYELFETVAGHEPESGAGSAPLLTVRDKTISAVQPALTAANDIDSYLLHISAQTNSPRKSALLVNSLAELYVQDQFRVKAEAIERATTWLSERVVALRVELENASSALNDFRAGAQLVNAESLQALTLELKSLRQRADDLQTEVNATSEKLRAMAAAAASGDRAEMAAAAGDTDLMNLVEGSAGAAETFSARYDALLRTLQQQLARQQSQLELVRQAVSEKAAKVEQQSIDAVRLRELEHEVEAARNVYEYFLQRMKETSAEQGMQEADSRILSYAVPSPIPIAPKKKLIIMLSATLGLMPGAGIVMLREARQQGVRSASELEALTGRPVLAQIPLVKALGRSSLLQYLRDKPSSLAAESVRTLRTSLMLSNIDTPPQVIMFTSAVPRDGKTTTSLALAQSYVGLGRSVLVMDCDLRRHTLSDYFGKRSRPGVVSVLTGAEALEDAVLRVDEGFDVLLGKDLQRSSGNAADIFSSSKFKMLIEDLRRQYQTIIIDTPPVLTVPDARIVGQIVDAIVFAARWDATSATQIAAGVESLERDKLRVIGTVLTQINPRKMRAYGYGYSYQYGYGGKASSYYKA